MFSVIFKMLNERVKHDNKLNDFIWEYKKTKHAYTKIKLTVCHKFTWKL